MMAAKPDWNDPTKWTVVPDLVGFMTHTRRVPRRDKKGQVVRDRAGRVEVETLHFDKQDLEEYAKNCNERDRLNQPSPLTLGHTTDDDDEKAQPDIVGYGREFRVEFDKDRGEHVLLFDAYFHPQDFERARQYPRISPEVWKEGSGRKILDPISLLKRTPQLDLGQWTFVRGDRDHRLRYALLQYPFDRRDPEMGTVRIRYAADDLPGEDEPPRRGPPPEGDDRGDDDRGPPPDDDRGPPPSGDDRDEGEGGPPPGVPPDFHTNFTACMRQYECGPGGKKKMAMGEGPGGGVLPSPTNAIPGRGRTPPPPPDDEERTTMRRAADRFERGQSSELRELYARIETLERGHTEKTADLQKRLRREKALNLVAQYFADCRCDHKVEADLLCGIEDDRWDDYLRYRQPTLRVDPAADRHLPPADDAPHLSRYAEQGGGERVVASGGAEGRPGAASEGNFDLNMLEKSAQYMRRHGGGPDKQQEAEQYARGLRALDGTPIQRNGLRR